MFTLLELSSIAKSNDLEDIMVVLFESENEKDLMTANNMNIIAEYLATRIREMDLLVGELDNCLSSTTAYESSKLLREMNDVDLAKAMSLMDGISHIQIKVIFMGRLLVPGVDDILIRLVDSLESWNAFPWGEHLWMHLYAEIINVVSNHKSEHLEGLHKSPKYVPTYTLSSFVWAFKAVRRGRRLLLEEERLNEEAIKVRLEKQKRLRLEEDRALEVKKK
nr:phospholipase-like protein [Tanacetum cinerariifolium]